MPKIAWGSFIAGAVLAILVSIVLQRRRVVS